MTTYVNGTEDLYAELNWRFTYHPPTGGKREAHERLRDDCLLLAHAMLDDLPEGRERSLAITNLEQAMFWGNAAIARSVSM